MIGELELGRDMNSARDVMARDHLQQWFGIILHIGRKLIELTGKGVLVFEAAKIEEERVLFDSSNHRSGQRAKRGRERLTLNSKWV